MERTPIWKPLLVVGAILLSIAAIWPPAKRLPLGLDLQGGTTLLYQVSVPPGTDAQREIDDTIAILRDRIDPANVRNLVWRQQAGHRIEIQMPRASPEAGRRRDEYLRQRQALLDGNLAVSRLDEALRAGGAARQAEFDRLAGDDPHRRDLLAELAQAYDALQEASGPKDEIQAQHREAEAYLEDLDPDASEEHRQRARETQRALLSELIERTRRYDRAERRYQAARQAVLAGNVELGEIENVLSLNNLLTPRSRERGETLSPRAQAVGRLIESHPTREAEIRAVAAAYGRYEEVKGTLDDPNDLIQMLRGSGVLEFRITASPAALPNLAEYYETLERRGPHTGLDRPYIWLPIDRLTTFAETDELQQALHDDPRGYFAARGQAAARHGDRIYLLVGNSPENSMTAAQPDWKLENAFPQPDNLGFPAVGFQLNALGGTMMGRLTSAHIGEPMAIVLDGRVMSAPNIQTTIHASGQITGGPGGYGPREQSYLVRTLKAGALKARLSEDPISIQKVGPSLGQDNLRRGLLAGVLALGLVCLFMIGYYFVFGLVANVALLLNLLLVLAVMAIFQATFTLPGIAGLVLAVGMAVDANILIYERIREELERKASLRTAIRLGYQRALSAIIDGNVTTIIACLILGYTATAEIKGFAITLGIGLVANLFTAIFCTRALIDTYVSVFRPQTMRQLPMVWPALRRVLTPNVNWVAKRHVFFAISAVLMIAGVTAMVVRGADFLDIEFRSGTQVIFETARDERGQPRHRLRIEEVRARLAEAAEKHGLDDLARAMPRTVGEVTAEGADSFIVQTLISDDDAVSRAIRDAFADVLEEQRTVAFAGMGPGRDVPPLVDAPVFPIQEGTLGANLGRPQFDQDVSEYLGGVAIVLEDLDPPLSVEQLSARILRMRFHPGHEATSGRQFQVSGLEPADAAADAPGGAGIRYRSLAVVSRDDLTNYAESPEQITQPGGLAGTEWDLVHNALRRETTLASVSKFDPMISRTMTQQAIVAASLSWIAIMIYVWLRFGSLAYGLSAVLTVIHDVIVAVGLAAMTYWAVRLGIGPLLALEAPLTVDLAFVAAVLTLIGYSVNDTIVTFDRIRENRGRLALASAKVINDSINQTLSRTILTSGTLLMAVLMVYLVAGASVHSFSFIMLVGSVIGAYSTIGVAAPLLLMFRRVVSDKVAPSTPPAATPPTAAATR